MEFTAEIKFTTVTPLCQIKGQESKMIDGKERKYIGVQKMGVLFGSDKKYFKTPFFTANGFRGKLRRAITDMIVTKAVENGASLGKSPTDKAKSFHAMNAGSSVTYNRPTFKDEDEVRKNNPLVSLLGTSLAISGKVAVLPLIPKQIDQVGDMTYCYHTSDEGHVYSNIVEIQTFYKKDDIVDHAPTTEKLGEDVIVEWEKLAREDGTQSASHVQAREVVIPGVDFFGGIVSLSELTDVEIGMLLRGLEAVAHKRLGSANSIGLGLVNYEIVINGGDGIIRSREDKFGTETIVSSEYSPELLEKTSLFDAWLENIDSSNIDVNGMLEK